MSNALHSAARSTSRTMQRTGHCCGIENPVCCNNAKNSCCSLTHPGEPHPRTITGLVPTLPAQLVLVHHLFAVLESRRKGLPRLGLYTPDRFPRCSLLPYNVLRARISRLWPRRQVPCNWKLISVEPLNRVARADRCLNPAGAQLVFPLRDQAVAPGLRSSHLGMNMDAVDTHRTRTRAQT